MAMSKKRKKNKRKLIEEVAERFAALLIMQIELDRKENPSKDSGLNFKKDTTIPSQQNYDNKN